MASLAAAPSYPPRSTFEHAPYGTGPLQQNYGFQHWGHQPYVIPSNPQFGVANNPNPKLTAAPTPQTPITPDALNNWWQTIYKGDQMWGPQSSGLRSQVGNEWQGGVRSPAQMAAMNYGQLDPDMLKKLAQFQTPEWFNPLTNKMEAVGGSLADALSGVAADAANNPYSALAVAAHNQGTRNAGWAANLASHGAMHSGSVARGFLESGWQAGGERAQAAQNFLGQVTGNYTDFLSKLGQDRATQEGYTYDMLQRIGERIASQQLLPPTTMQQLHPNYPPKYGTPAAGAGFQSNRGPYGGKILY